MQESDFLKMFQVSIQFGAILIVVLYWKKFFDFKTLLFFKMAFAVIPALVLGYLLMIRSKLF
jgi:undecaprenyl-diphosphatase